MRTDRMNEISDILYMWCPKVLHVGYANALDKLNLPSNIIALIKEWKILYAQHDYNRDQSC